MTTDRTNLDTADLRTLQSEFSMLAIHFNAVDASAKTSVFAQMLAVKASVITAYAGKESDLTPEAAHTVASMNFALSQFATSLKGGRDDA